MSDLTAMERLKLEKALQMSEGYVLNFNNRTFAEFILLRSIGISFSVDLSAGGLSHR